MRMTNVQGFTLVEVMVSVGLTSLIIGVITSLLFVGLSVQRQSLAVQGILSQGSTVTEYMTRALKQARKDTTWTCLSGSGPNHENYQLTHSGKGVKFVNVQGECQDFYLEGDRIKETRGVQTVFLSSDDVSILAFNPFLAGQSQIDTLQPKVMFYIDMQGKGAKPNSPQQRFQIQTTISQRAYDLLQ